MPVIPAVAAVWSAIGAFQVAGLAIGVMAQQLVISSGLAFLAKSLGVFEADEVASNYSIKGNSTTGEAPLVIIYGERTTGGNEWRGTSGDTNQILHRVMCLGEGEVEGVQNVYFDDVDIDSEDFQYRYLVTYTVHEGTNGQAADPGLVSEVEDWGPDARGFGVAYIYVRTQFSVSAFSSGMPGITAKVRGLKVYDPRTGLTAWSQNPALCLRDYWTNTQYGVGIPEARINEASFIEAANYCDELVTFKDSEGLEFPAPRYTCNGVLNPDDGLIKNSNLILLSCRGIPVYSGGEYSLIIDKPEVSSFDFNESNIIGSWSFSGNSKRSILNQVRARFYDKSINWDPSLTTIGDESFIAADNGQVFEEDLFYPLTDEMARVAIMAQHHVKQARQGLTSSFTSTLEALACTVGQVVNITHPTPGWDAKLFRIQKMTLEAEDVIRVMVSEYDPSVYTFDILQPPVIPDSNLINPFSTPPPSALVLESGTEHLQVAPDSTVITQMLAAWTAAPSSFVDRYEIGYKLSANTGWTNVETSEVQHYFAPVVEGYNYDVRVRAVYYTGGRSAWLLLENYTVIGKTEAPASPGSFSYASQRDYTREFSWTPNTMDLDVKGYLIRFSTDLAASWEDMTPLHDGFLLSSPWETNLLNAGTYRFAIKTVDTSGNQSSIARYMEATLADSPTSSIFYSRYPRLEGWPGIITGYIGNTGGLESNDPTTWDDLGDLTWDQFEEWGRDGDDLVYQFSDMDLGAILTFRPVVSVQGQGAVSYEVDYSEDNITWNGWEVPAADITGRYLRVKITVVHQEAYVNSMSILLDGAKKSEDIEDLDTSTITGAGRLAVGNIRLPLVLPFTTVKTVSITLHNTGPGWSWELIDKDAVNGPQIKIYDNTGTLADATLDAVVNGY